MNPDTQYDDAVSTLLLENIKNKLIHAFRANGEPLPAGGSGADTVSIFKKNFQANEELRRAKIDGAISWLRSELVGLQPFRAARSSTLTSFPKNIDKH